MDKTRYTSIEILENSIEEVVNELGESWIRVLKNSRQQNKKEY